MDEVLRALREMSSEEQVKANPAGLQALSSAALDKMKKLEFDLRKRADTTSDEMFLSGADEAPTQVPGRSRRILQAAVEGRQPGEGCLRAMIGRRARPPRRVAGRRRLR